MVVSPTELFTVPVQIAIGILIPYRLRTNEYISQYGYNREEAGVA
jgi:hypothetical protein